MAIVVRIEHSEFTESAEDGDIVKSDIKDWTESVQRSSALNAALFIAGENNLFDYHSIGEYEDPFKFNEYGYYWSRSENGVGVVTEIKAYVDSSEREVFAEWLYLIGYVKGYCLCESDCPGHCKVCNDPIDYCIGHGTF